MLDPRSRQRFARFSWATLAFTLAVIAWGAFVRASGSGAGCGSHWPDCNGEIVPRAESLETAIELTHRITSGLSLILVVAQVVFAWRVFAPGHRVRSAAAATLLFMTLEAAIGAGIVLLELVGDDASSARALWIALHLTNTFLLVAAQSLTAYWARDRAPAQLLTGGSAVPLVSLGALLLIVTGVTGAITALGDTLFPSASLGEGLAADASPTAHFLVRLRVLHPLIATLAFVLISMVAGTLVQQRPSGRVRRLAMATVAVMIAQMGAGLINLALLAPIPMQLVHLLLADLVWIAFVLLSAEALATPHAHRTAELPTAAE